MNNGSVEGHIVRIFDEQKIGKKLVKEFWIKVSDDYNNNNYCSFTLRGKNVLFLDQIFLGDPVTVFFNVVGRLHRSRIDIDLRCFATLEAWKVQYDDDRKQINTWDLERDFAIQKMRQCKTISDLNLVERENKKFSKDADFINAYSQFKNILRSRL